MPPCDVVFAAVTGAALVPKLSGQWILSDQGGCARCAVLIRPTEDACCIWAGRISVSASGNHFKYGGERGGGVLGLSMPSLCGPRWARSKAFLAILSNQGSNQILTILPNTKSPFVRGLWYLAEREGFEPSIRCRIHTFQACSFNHSDTSPDISNCLRIRPDMRCFAKGARCVLVARAVHALVPAGPAIAVLDCSRQSSQPLGHLSRYITNCRRSGCCALFRQGARCVLVTRCCPAPRPLGQLTMFAVLICSGQISQPLGHLSSFIRLSSRQTGKVLLFRERSTHCVLVTPGSCPSPLRGQPLAVLICSRQISQPLGHLSRFFKLSANQAVRYCFAKGACCVFFTRCYPYHVLELTR